MYRVCTLAPLAYSRMFKLCTGLLCVTVAIKRLQFKHHTLHKHVSDLTFRRWCSSDGSAVLNGLYTGLVVFFTLYLRERNTLNSSL